MYYNLQLNFQLKGKVFLLLIYKFIFVHCYFCPSSCANNSFPFWIHTNKVVLKKEIIWKIGNRPGWNSPLIHNEGEMKWAKIKRNEYFPVYSIHVYVQTHPLAGTLNGYKSNEKINRNGWGQSGLRVVQIENRYWYICILLFCIFRGSAYG